MRDLGGKRQVIQRDEQGAPVLCTAGNGQAVGEQPRRGVVVAPGQPDLAEEVIHVDEGQLLLKPVVPGEVVQTGALLGELVIFLDALNGHNGPYRRGDSG